MPRLPNASLPGPPDAKANGRPQAPSTDTKTEPHDLPKADSGLIAGLPPGFTRPRKSLTPVKPTLPPHAPAPGWSGALAKSGKLICPILCMNASILPGSSHAASDLEPADWPQQLDVDNRIDVPSVYNSYDRALADQRAVRRLALPPCPTSGGEALLQHQQHRRAFVEFLNYLSGKRRAGVVQLRPSGMSMGGQPRILYLIPASASVIDRFHLVWEPTELLVAVLVQKSAQ